MLRIRFVVRGQCLRDGVLKGVYRLMPAWLKRMLFRKFVGAGPSGNKDKD